MNIPYVSRCHLRRKIVNKPNELFLKAEHRKVNTMLPSHDFVHIETLDHIPDSLSQPVDDLISHLDRSTMQRVQDIPQSP